MTIGINDFSACIEMLFEPESGSYAERARLAGKCGFPAFEFWDWRSKDIKALVETASATGVSIAGFLVSPTRNLGDPGMRPAFLEDVAAAREVALELNVPNMIVTAGKSLPGIPRATQLETLAQTLREGAELLNDTPVSLALEAIHRAEFGDGLIWLLADAVGVCRMADHPRAGILADIYHAAMEDESVADALDGHVDLVRHVHLADAPGRHEPGTGHVNWRETLNWFRANGYKGRFGLEYRPAGGTRDGLEFLSAT